MIQIKNFLDKKTCDYCIDFIEKNIHDAGVFEKRKVLQLDDYEDDNVIKDVIYKYRYIRPLSKLKTIEIVKWLKDEYINWHTDSIYYNDSTITYLNDSFKGGVTTVESYEVKPETGKMIMFPSNTLHKANKVIKGDRYIIGAWYINGKTKIY